MLKPAIKLLEFFKSVPEADLDMGRHGRVDAETGGLATFMTDKAQSASRILREVVPVEAKMLNKFDLPVADDRSAHRQHHPSKSMDARVLHTSTSRWLWGGRGCRRLLMEDFAVHDVQNGNNEKCGCNNWS